MSTKFNNSSSIFGCLILWFLCLLQCFGAQATELPGKTDSGFSQNRKSGKDVIIYGFESIINLPASISFGDVPVGGTVQASLNIVNTGNAEFDVYSISCPDFLTCDNWSGRVIPGAPQTVTVTFSPTLETNYTGTITIDSDADQGNNTISVSGAGYIPRQIVNLSGDLSFSNVLQGAVRSSTMVISNAGNVAITVTNISLPTGFSGNCSGILVPNKIQIVTIKFEPTAARFYEGTVLVSSSASTVQGVLIASGAGIAPTPPKVKILAPSSSQKMTNALASFSGTTTYPGEVDGVWFQFDGASWCPVQTTNNWTNWTETLPLLAGTNTFDVFAVVAGGIYSKTNSVSIVSASTFKLNLALALPNSPAINATTVYLRLSGNLTGYIQYSTNLIDWTDWTNFGGTNLTMTFRALVATNSSGRSYPLMVP
jgi:hypothetical protein